MLNKQICFLEPPIGYLRDQLDPPFPLMYLSAVAERCGWQAQIVHMQTLQDKLPEADIYGVTSSSPQWPDTLKLSSRLFVEYSDKWRICGGSHISACPNNYYNSSFNTAVIGEGELALEQFLQMPKTGIIYGEPVKDLDCVPFPARHLINWSKYKRGIYWGKECLSLAVSMITSRGCPFSCIFCSSHCVFGRRVRFRSVGNVVAEIHQVLDTLGYRGFNFHDDTFCVNRKRVADLCREFTPLDIVWRCLTRADTVDHEILTAMKNSGCKEVILGMESGSQKILNNLRKGTTVEQNLRAMKLIKESGIQLKVGIIVGSPGETWETVKETEKLLKQCPPDFWNVSVFTPLPGSDVWNNPEQFDLKILTRDLTQYQMVGKDFRGTVVVETEKMSKTDIEQARDELIDLCTEISGT